MAQNRCVFVGNIPYNATEEQLIKICEEIGPVVSFRLVLDKETGKPRGYGFCEYKDEETALSARRNLQGYEVNGRQLRVDFVENGKNSDRNRNLDRGGPSLGPNLGTTQHPSGAIPADSAANQLLGLSSALAAFSAMVSALGGTQSRFANQTGADPLTNYLARMSRHQLLGILSEMKLLIAQNNHMLRKLLQQNPVLLRAMFQAEIMFGIATPQMMQMASSQPHSSLSSQSQMPQQLVAAISVQSNPPAGNPNLVEAQNSIPVVQVPLLHQQVPITTLGGPSMLQPVQTHPNVAASVELVPQLQSTVLQQNLRPPFGVANLVHQPAPPVPSVIMRQKHLVRSASQIVPPNEQLLTARADTGKGKVEPGSELIHPSKSRRLDDMNGVSVCDASLIQAAGRQQSSGQSAVRSAGPASQMSSSTLVQPEKPTQQLSSETQSSLLQQVLNLIPDQLSSLPINVQQQVIQLQKSGLVTGSSLTHQCYFP